MDIIKHATPADFPPELLPAKTAKILLRAAECYKAFDENLGLYKLEEGSVAQKEACRMATIIYRSCRAPKWLRAVEKDLKDPPPAEAVPPYHVRFLLAPVKAVGQPALSAAVRRAKEYRDCYPGMDSLSSEAYAAVDTIAYWYNQEHRSLAERWGVAFQQAFQATMVLSKYRVEDIPDPHSSLFQAHESDTGILATNDDIPPSVCADYVRLAGQPFETLSQAEERLQRNQTDTLLNRWMKSNSLTYNYF
ncbi:hypothetical protein OAM01_02275 [bacterium]|nr:hypothetical protein [bacterium]